jgi:hypothetical protein
MRQSSQESYQNGIQPKLALPSLQASYVLNDFASFNQHQRKRCENLICPQLNKTDQRSPRNNIPH